MFKDFAPKYWAAGLPVMPLRPQTKVPALNSWQAYCAAMPTEDDQKRWMDSYPDGNMGLPLGPQSGIVALDLDSIDPKVQEILDKHMPASPWKRIGKKGAVYAFRYNGERTYRIKDDQNNTIMEVLSRGAQIVLPPSIHPDTMKPYTANCELVDVLDKLPTLPGQFEVLIRQALIDAGIKLSSRGSNKVTEWVPAGGRDSAMVAMAGLLARAVLRKERDLLSALSEMEAWIATYTEKVVGDTLDPEQGRRKVLEFLRRDVVDNHRQLPEGWSAGMPSEEIAKMKEFFGEDAEEWPLQKQIGYIEQQFKLIPKEDVPGRQAVIEDSLYRISRSDHFTSIDVDVLLNYIQNASGRVITASGLRKRLNELKAGELQGIDHTEIAQALVKDLEREGELRFDQSGFHQWFGAHWRRLEDHEISRRMSLEFGKLPAARKFNDHKGIIQLAQKLCAAKLRTLDVPGINFANGYLTDDMELLPHDQRYGATYVLPYRYVPNDRAPAMFMSFLDQCWGHDSDYLEKVQALREAIAATLFGRATIFQRAFCLFGVAGSGKSTLMNIILGLLPDDAVCRVPPQDWGDRFMPTRMAGRLVNACGELSESSMIPGAVFKMIIEGLPMSGQFKGQDIFEFKPMCSQWFCSNHLPRSRDSSAGFNRRWLLWDFNKVVQKDQKRADLHLEILSEEREAIVAWAIGAIQDLIRNSDYTLPSSHLHLINEVASQNNSVRFFLTAGEGVSVNKDGDKRADEKKLYPLYYAFCKLKANVPPVSLKRFRMMMQELQADLGHSTIIDIVDGQEVVSYANVQIAESKTRRAAA